MVIFARGREIVPIFAMSDPWLASKNMEHPPRAIRRIQGGGVFAGKILEWLTLRHLTASWGSE